MTNLTKTSENLRSAIAKCVAVVTEAKAKVALARQVRATKEAALKNK